MKKKSILTMAFYHENGIVPAWKQAAQFAGENGRIATMPDIVDARIATGIDGHPWNTYYTTATAEYFGYSKGGNRILIVAHGVGPMSTLEGIQKAYSYEYKDKTRSNNGGRISEQEFRKLENGFYGDVSIVEFDRIISQYVYPFMEYLKADEAMFEPLLRARLGSRAEEYLNHHAEMAMIIHEKEHGKIIGNPYIIKMGAASNCSYAVGGFVDFPIQYPFLDKGDGSVAHLISTGRLSSVHHENERRVPFSIANDIDCHEWGNGTRFVAVRENTEIKDIHPGFGNIGNLILKNWDSLMKKTDGVVLSDGFYALMETADNTWFTQYPKKGIQMDTYEPEFHVTSIEKIGEPVDFITEIGGYYGFFKYDVKGVLSIKPPQANAYFTVGDAEIIRLSGNSEKHKVGIQFYRAKVDTSQRLIRSRALVNDYDKLMYLLSKKD